MDASTKERIAEFICGDDATKFPVYRSSSYLTKFFTDLGINKTHDGSTRKWWTLNVINELKGPDLQNVILRLASPKLYSGDREKIKLAIHSINEILDAEGFKIIFEGSEPKLTKHIPNYNFEAPPAQPEEKELKPLPPPDFDALGLEVGLSDILQKRWDEIQKCIDSNATLSALIMMGSMLEGFLLGIMLKQPKFANTAALAPKKDGKVKQFYDWKLAEMIDVAHEIGWIQLDVKKFSHALREFRNLIHPYEQLSLKTYPNLDTCNISWLVVQAACNNIAEWIKKNP